jgi:hypothetical protein
MKIPVEINGKQNLGYRKVKVLLEKQYVLKASCQHFGFAKFKYIIQNFAYQTSSHLTAFLHLTKSELIDENNFN